MKLKPCAHCGNKDIYPVRTIWLDELCIMIRCNDCGVMLIRLARTKPKVVLREVEEAWNVRTHYVKEPYDGRHAGKRGAG